MNDLLWIMWLPFLACLVLSTILGYLGLHVLARGIIFVALALAQFAGKSRKCSSTPTTSRPCGNVCCGQGC